MATMSSAIPLTGVPFPRSEYERRQLNVLETVAGAGLDALVVTAHGHLRYLSGYDGSGGYFAPFPLIMVPGRSPTFIVRQYDEQAVRSYGCINEIVTYTHQQDFGKVCADVLRRYGLQGKRIGLELGCWNLALADVNALQAQLPDLKIADATRLVSLVAAVKGELELGCMRDAMRLTDLAVRTFQNSLREGVTELEIAEAMAAAIEADASNVGGEIGMTPPTILFGERTKLPHGPPSRHPISNNEPAFLEIGASKHGYSVGMVRCAVLGRHPEAESLHTLAEEVIEALVAAVKPGTSAAAVDAAGREVLTRSGRKGVFRQRTGYQTGINWTERGDLSLEPGSQDILKSGMTLHMPNILCSENGYLFGSGAHVLVTERGAELLSQTPPTLYRA
ncbi:MAG: aminopeptidase P family protein [Mesorhizobium sp.]|uniref:M24 family metallopeptidase n=1 Tax=Mesorhizobium sp. TaxID=1871066 RepID=UPI000FE800CC|nr:Xaa-Pro peptidase family protein [Mesorhizobium sp.]RWO21052.1 MAG: aminopeptidase P family protein [Mesorhizobium sp.]TIQ03253.1 MAG: aminopeptidase P family protein [Mesorhizobium sp.]TJV46809.1 MAG: aminopeptidase P family protein [Mesorhizobium sp.]